jgi:hypothetical protein
METAIALVIAAFIFNNAFTYYFWKYKAFKPHPVVRYGLSNLPLIIGLILFLIFKKPSNA